MFARDGLSFRKPGSSLEQRPGGRLTRPRHRQPKPHCVPKPLDAASHPQPSDAFLGDLARPQLHVTGKGRCEGPVVFKACLMFVSWDRKAPVTKLKSMPVSPQVPAQVHPDS